MFEFLHECFSEKSCRKGAQGDMRARETSRASMSASPSAADKFVDENGKGTWDASKHSLSQATSEDSVSKIFESGGVLVDFKHGWLSRESSRDSAGGGMQTQVTSRISMLGRPFATEEVADGKGKGTQDASKDSLSKVERSDGELLIS